jgi:spore coat protein U-like protein
LVKLRDDRTLFQRVTHMTNQPKKRLNRGSALHASALFLVAAAIALPQPALAGSATTTLGVSLTINAGCNVSSTSVAFPAQSVLASGVNQTGTVAVTCTNTTPYNIELDQGAGSGATVTNRLMTGPSSATVAYGLYQDSGHSTNWGKTDGTDTVAGTGNGSAQTLTVYGHIAAQTTPAPGSYADTVNVTVTF